MDIPAAYDDLPLFVYGTLRFARVLDALLGRVPEAREARLGEWRAAALEERPYPGLVPAPGGSVRGLLLSGLTAREAAALDAFEGGEYEQRRVTLADGSPARTYVWRDAEGPAVRTEDWDARRYADRVLAAYGSRSAPG